MGLMDKIDAKLHKDKHQDDKHQDDKHKASTSENQYGVSDNYKTTSSTDYATSGSTSDPRYGGSSTTNSSKYGGSSPVDRENYGGHHSSSTYRPSHDEYGTSTGTHHSTHGVTPDGTHHGSSSNRHTHDHPTSDRTEPHQPFDPYSSKGQRAAAGDPNYSSSTSGKHMPGPHDDPSVSRSTHGRITNHPRDPTNNIPKHPGYDSGAQTGYSSRDAAMAGGTGGGAYEAARHAAPGVSSAYDQPSHSHGSVGGGQGFADPATAARGGSTGGFGGEPGYAGGYPQQHASGMPVGGAGMNQPGMGGHGMQPGMTGQGMGQPGMAQSGMPGQGMGGLGMGQSGMAQPGMGGQPDMGAPGGEGINPARKMGGAYERGYQDAMEHVKADMGQK